MRARSCIDSMVRFLATPPPPAQRWTSIHANSSLVRFPLPLPPADRSVTYTDSDGNTVSETNSRYGDTCHGHGGSDIFPFGLLDTDIDGFEVGGSALRPLAQPIPGGTDDTHPNTYRYAVRP